MPAPPGFQAGFAAAGAACLRLRRAIYATGPGRELEPTEELRGFMHQRNAHAAELRPEIMRPLQHDKAHCRTRRDQKKRWCRGTYMDPARQPESGSSNPINKSAKVVLPAKTVRPISEIAVGGIPLRGAAATGWRDHVSYRR
jgi:hypothetical protein